MEVSWQSAYAEANPLRRAHESWVPGIVSEASERVEAMPAIQSAPVTARSA